MGRARKPTKILELTGRLKHDPQRRQGNEPAPAGVFPAKPPGHLDEPQAAAWVEIVAAVPAGVLSNADIFIVEVAAALLAEYRSDRQGMPTTRIARLTGELNKLGCEFA